MPFLQIPPSPPSFSVLQEAEAGKDVQNVIKNAVAGDTDAQFKLGSLYDLGQGGLPQDEEKAIKWWKKAAFRNGQAAYALALCYQFGEGVPPDPKKMKFYEEQASRLGNADASLALGLMYQLGRVVEKNGAQALRYYQLAALQGSLKGQIILGTAYLSGIGGQKKPQKALECWQKAANKKSAEAQRLLGMLYSEGDEGIAPNPGLARYWLLKSAEQGNAKAQYQLGGIYERENTPHDLRLAMHYYQQASLNGDRKAKWRLKMLQKKQYHGTGDE